MGIGIMPPIMFIMPFIGIIPWGIMPWGIIPPIIGIIWGIMPPIGMFIIGICIWGFISRPLRLVRERHGRPRRRWRDLYAAGAYRTMTGLRNSALSSAGNGGIVRSLGISPRTRRLQRRKRQLEGL
jgi:hypothetical protein